MHLLNKIVFPVFIILCFCISGQTVWAQQRNLTGAAATLGNTQQQDTANQTNTNEWINEETLIYFKKNKSEIKYYPDTSLHHFHRRPFLNSWNQYLGNPGSAATNLLFTPTQRTGPALGYTLFDVYQYNEDSLLFYNTTRPYSSFSYQLGSKAEQAASLLHTQNILPNWNIAVQYRKINAPGFYKIQRNNHDNAYLSSNYQSKNEHYQMNAALIYNREQADENGGIVADSFLSNDNFDDRRTIPVRFQNDAYSVRRSGVTNTMRDFSILLRHGYTAGKRDTTYNEDSSSYSTHLIPRFRVLHRMEISSWKYRFNDQTPDSLRYDFLFQKHFAATDSVYMRQQWFYIDNAISLNGFVGKENKQLGITAGLGNRFDRFQTNDGISNSKLQYGSNYVFGGIVKENLEPGQWSYDANIRFYFTGQNAGNFLLRANIGKRISEKIGMLQAGIEQQLNNAPYNYQRYQNAFYTRSPFYNKETVSMLYGKLDNDNWKLEAGLKNYVVGNYFYLNQSQEFAQYSKTFNISQVWLRKQFEFGIFVLDNELVYQQKTAGAPVNIPSVIGKHQISIETYLFRKALKIATGFDVSWHTAYAPSAYSPFFARYYYQDTYNISNAPQAGFFFNFKIKSFRAFLAADQLQQLFTDNFITAPGYPAQDFMIRFGFNWTMVN